MSSTWVVDVAVPVPLRQSFTYKLPAGLDPKSVQPGFRVLVPFRARLMHGVTLTEARLDENASSKIRALVRYDDDQRILAPEIHKLADWIVRYYRGPVGEVIKMALPPGMLSEKEIMFRLSKQGEDFLAESDGVHVLGLLAKKALTKRAWETASQTKIKMADIRRWEEEGLLEIAVRGEVSESIPHVTVYQLTPTGKLTESLKELTRAKKQLELLEWCQNDTETYITTADIPERFKGASTLLSALVKRGFMQKMRIPKHELDRQRAVVEPENVVNLTDEQDVALTEVNAALDENKYRAFLMFGVTGAGKTEIYLRAIQHCLAQGKQALFLVPEIGLTPLMQRRIVDRFGDHLAILHSAVGAARRAESWARILAGKVDVVLGARSGIFAPLPRLGLIIVDEEHDGSYKQNDGVRYHGRDLAMVRAKFSEATIVLGSATPSLESWQNYLNKRSQLLTLEHRATKAPLPVVEIVDMREEFKQQRKRPLLSQKLEAKITQELEQGHQIMILLNRRGYYSFLLCRRCGEAVMCPNCEVTFTYHATDKTLRCHYCATSAPVPEKCPSCNSPATVMQFFGEGTQQLQEYLEQRFPEVTVDRLDRDRLTTKDAHAQILANFEANRTRILVGTQMIAKGHDFPNVTLVGIVNADFGLRIPDFRCAEVVFQLVTQVAGRSGRGQKPGSVVIQTYMPEHYSIQAAAKHDFRAFLSKEMRYRQHLFYSPFAHMVAILITHPDAIRANQVSFWMAEQCNQLGAGGKMIVLGPAKAPIGRIKNAWRYQIVLKSKDRQALHRYADLVVEETVKRGMLPRQAIIMDIDPYSFF